MMHVFTVRSPSARGKIISIDYPQMPRGYFIIQAQDIPGENVFSSFDAISPLLADRRVSYIGEPVALVVGPDPEKSEILRDQITVQVEEEKPRFSCDVYSEDQVLCRRTIRHGSPEIAFSVASKVMENHYQTGSQENLYSEPQGAFCIFDYDTLLVRCATQWPDHVKKSVAIALGVNPDEIIIVPSPLGTHFDSKVWYPSLLSCHAALATRISGKPSRIMLSRMEDFKYSPKRAKAGISHKTALDPEGLVSAMEIRISLDMGAFAPLAGEILSRACIDACGFYSIPNVLIEGTALMTNTPPMGSFAGLGSSQSFYAIETHFDRIVRELGADPIKWKGMFMVSSGKPPITGESAKEENPYTDLAALVSASSDFSRKHACYQLLQRRRSSGSEGPYRGIGFAYACQGSGSLLSVKKKLEYRVIASLDKDLSLKLNTFSPGASAGMMEIWRKRAQEILGIPLEKIYILTADMENISNSNPPLFSSSLTIISHLVENSCEAIRKKRFRDTLPLSAASSYKAPGKLSWHGENLSGNPYDSRSFCAAVVEIELDSWTFEPQLRGLWLAVDGGNIVSEVNARRSLETGALEALSKTLYESIEFEDGKVPDRSYYRYHSMPLNKSPPVHIDFLAARHGKTIKGIGDLPWNTVPSALAQAIAQASDSSASDIPIDGSRCFEKAMHP